MSQLIYVKNDKLWTRVRRRGRFAIPRDCARSPRHFAAAVYAAQKMLADGLEKEGFRFIEWPDDGRPDPAKPLPIHLDESLIMDDTPDPGPYARMPEITPLGHFDQAAMDAYERAEKTRQSWEAGQATNMVDYRVVGVFETQVPTHYRAHVKESKR